LGQGWKHTVERNRGVLAINNRVLKILNCDWRRWTGNR